MSDNFVDNAPMDLIPDKAPVILFLLDEESVFYHTSRGQDVITTHEEARADIAAGRKARFDRVTLTTDIASADYSLLDHFIVGIQRSDKLGLSLETVYMWLDTDGTPYRTSAVRLNEPDDLLGAILEGSVF